MAGKRERICTRVHFFCQIIMLINKGVFCFYYYFIKERIINNTIFKWDRGVENWHHPPPGMYKPVVSEMAPEGFPFSPLSHDSNVELGVDTDHSVGSGLNYTFRVTRTATLEYPRPTFSFSATGMNSAPARPVQGSGCHLSIQLTTLIMD